MRRFGIIVSAALLACFLCATAWAAPVHATRSIGEDWCVDYFAVQARQVGDGGSNERRDVDPVGWLEGFIAGSEGQYILGL